MKEISEELRATILAAIPTDNLVLLYAPLRGTSPTIVDRVSSANNGTFTNPKWKTLKNGLVVPNYDGTAYIKKATANWRSTDSQGAVVIAFRQTVAAACVLFSSSDEASATRYNYFGVTAGRVLDCQQRNNDTLDRVIGSTVFSLNKWNIVFYTSGGSAYTLYVNGSTAETLTLLSGANSGDWFADTSARDNFLVGALNRTALSSYFTGQTGLVAVYSVAPSTTQILRMTKRLKGVFH